MINHSLFVVSKYSVKPGPGATGILIAEGEKTGRPSSRIVLNQKGLKVNHAAVRSNRKNKLIEYEVKRINHLPTFEEVRVHTAAPLYPGAYEVEIEFEPLDKEAVRKLSGDSLAEISLRSLFPSSDSEQARKNARLEIDF